MELVNNEDNKITITIDYSGENIKNHTMDIREFTKSLNAFYDILQLFSEEYGFNKNDIKIEIKDVNEGSLKVVLFFALSLVMPHYFDKVLNKFDNYCVEIYKNIKKTIEEKKKIENKNDINNLILNEPNPIIAKIYKNNNFYKSINDFTICLDYDVENIYVNIDKYNQPINISKSERKNLSYIPDFNDEKEKIKEEKMTLYLDGISGSTEKWIFIKKEKNNEISRLTAKVLSEKLLDFGKNTPYNDYSKTPIFCNVRIVTSLKDGNKNKTTEYFIIDCDIEKELDLFNNIK